MFRQEYGTKLVSYEDALKAYQFASSARRERDREIKDHALFKERVGFGFESDYHLKISKKYLEAMELLRALPLEMKSNLERDLTLKNSFDERLNEIIIENAC